MHVADERVGRNDFIQVEHESSKFLLVIKETKRTESGYTANCEIVGKGPKSPFKTGEPVFLATEDGVAQFLGIATTEREGLYLGILRGHRSRVYLPFGSLGRVFIVGKPGSGKSFTAGVMTEEIMKKGIPVLVIDLHGEYSSLKVPTDQRAPGSDIESQGFADQIVEFAHTALNPGADLEIHALGRARAEDIIVPGQCTIVNLRGLTDDEQEQIATETASRVLEAAISGKVNPFYLILDEAHRFAGKEKTKAGEIFKRFAQEGRKFGANLIVITQRPQLLDVTVRSLSGTWIIHRLTDPNDVRIVTESGGLSKEWDHDINWFESGEVVVTGEVAEKIPFIVKVRQRHTRHGAPGFNPLDFVDAEQMQKISARKEALKKRLAFDVIPVAAKPAVPESLNQAFVQGQYGVEEMRATMQSSCKLDCVTIDSTEFHYGPALLCESAVHVRRDTPPTAYSDSLKRLVPSESRVGSPDWRAEEVYSVQIGDLTASMMSASPRDVHVQYLPVVSQLMKQESVDELKRDFKRYAAAKLTKTVLQHASLNLTSVPSVTPEEFRQVVEGEITRLVQERTAAVEAEYKKEADVIQAKTTSIQSELRLASNYIGALRQEIDELRKQRATAYKAKRGTLQLNERIYKRETRLARLEAQAKELESKVSHGKDELNKLAILKEHKMREVSRQLHTLGDEVPRSLAIDPRDDEISLASFQLVWIPLCRAMVTVSRGNLSSELDVWWNAVNGKGYFGDCAACGKPIDTVTASWLCHLDLAPTCGQHATLCAVCQENTCQDHTWTCATCGKHCCTTEEIRKCEACATNLCANCAIHCTVCGVQKFYDARHVKVCQICGQTYCGTHYSEHFAPCGICGKNTCFVEQVKCSICGGTVCETHSGRCPICDRFLCDAHLWTCTACSRKLCSEENRTPCYICRNMECGDCIRTCHVCGSKVCPAHATLCSRCGRITCVQHMRTRRKLLVKTEQICQRCCESLG